MALETVENENKISRSLMAWINTYPNLPVSIVNFEQLRNDEVSMALSTVQAAKIVSRYITGGHKGEYQFKLIYRIKPANSNDKRLKADELLDTIGEWAESNPPSLGNDIVAVKVEATTRASLFANYDNGEEDHQVFMTLTYEVF